MFSFKDVGGKLMMLAKIIMWIGIVISVLAGASIIISGGAALGEAYGSMTGAPAIICGIFVILIGSICSWLEALGLYALGDLVKNVQKIANEKSAE